MYRKAPNTLKGKKLCLRCRHLNNGSLDMMKRICLCAVPFLVPAEEITVRSIAELRAKYHFAGEQDE